MSPFQVGAITLIAVGTDAMRASSFAVLLKNGILAVMECASTDVFNLARERNAGICGVFRTREDADEFVSLHSFAGHHRREGFFQTRPNPQR